MGIQDPLDTNQVLNSAVVLARIRFPAASERDHKVAASMVYYVLTGSLVGEIFDGPTLREIAANIYLRPYAERSTFDEAVDLVMSADGPVYGPIIGGKHEALFVTVLVNDATNTFDNSLDDIDQLRRVLIKLSVQARFSKEAVSELASQFHFEEWAVANWDDECGATGDIPTDFSPTTAWLNLFYLRRSILGPVMVEESDEEIVEIVLDRSRELFPKASERTHYDAAATVCYLVSDTPPSFGGRTIRELAAQILWQPSRFSNSLDEAIALVVNAEGPIYCPILGGKHETLFLFTLASDGATSFDNTPDDLEGYRRLLISWSIAYDVAPDEIASNAEEYGIADWATGGWTEHANEALRCDPAMEVDLSQPGLLEQAWLAMFEMYQAASMDGEVTTSTPGAVVRLPESGAQYTTGATGDLFSLN